MSAPKPTTFAINITISTNDRAMATMVQRYPSPLTSPHTSPHTTRTTNHQTINPSLIQPLSMNDLAHRLNSHTLTPPRANPNTNTTSTRSPSPFHPRRRFTSLEPSREPSPFPSPRTASTSLTSTHFSAPTHLPSPTHPSVNTHPSIPSDISAPYNFSPIRAPLPFQARGYTACSAAAIRRQRQRALRSQCTATHLEAIEALVERMGEGDGKGGGGIGGKSRGGSLGVGLAAEVDLVGEMEGMVVDEALQHAEPKDVERDAADDERVDEDAIEIESSGTESNKPGTRSCVRGRRDSGTGLWRSDGGVRKCTAKRRAWTSSSVDRTFAGW